MSALGVCILLCLTINNLTASIPMYSNNNYSLHNNETTEIDCNMIKYLLDIIYKHSDFELIFHFDTFNLNYVDDILNKMNAKMMKSLNLIMYNDETKLKNLFKRPVVRKIFNLIILNDLDRFSTFLNKSVNINDADEAIFVLTRRKRDITFLTSNKYIKIFGKILVIYVDSFEKVVLSTICYFCGKNSDKLRELTWNLNEVVETQSDKKDFSNLLQHNFNIGFVNYFPFIWCENLLSSELDDNRTMMICSKVKGSDFKLTQIMAKTLNFTYTFVLYEDYISLIQDLVHKQIDFIIGGVTPTAKRMAKGTITRPYWFESYNFLYVLSTSLREELSRIFDPFNGYLWLLMVSSIFITSFLFYAIDRFESESISNVSCLDSISMCFLMVIEQNAKLKEVFKVRVGPAILIISWILFCLNISVAYKSKLASLVMHPPYKEPGNIRELVENNYKFVINQQYRDVFVNLLLNTTDSVVEHASNITYGTNDLCEEFIFAVENRAAILDEYSTLQFDLRKSCKDVLRAKRSDTESESGTKIRITKTALRTIGHVWLLQKKAVFRSVFDYILARIVEAGLVEVWFVEQTKHMVKDSFPRTHNKAEHFYNPLSIRLLLSLFFLYVVGNLVAMAVFLLELYANRRKSSKMFQHISASKFVSHKD